MKKTIKVLMVALFVSFAFILSACGGNANPLDTEVKVDLGTETNYVACTEQNSLMVALGEMMPEEPSQPGNSSQEPVTIGVKFTFNSDVTIPVGVMGPVATEMNVNMTAIMQYAEENIEFASKVTMTMANEEMAIEMYIKDNVLYMNDGETKTKMPLDSLMGENPGEPTTPAIDFEAMGESIVAVLGDHTKQKIDTTTEGTTRYMLNIDEGKVVYVVIKDGQIAQAYVEIDEINVKEVVAMVDPTMAEQIPAIVMGVELGLEMNSSEIQYPSFDEYQLASAQ